MKRFCLVFVSLFLYVTIVFGQADKKNVVKVFPTSFVFGKGTFGFERALTHKSALTFNLGVPTGSSPYDYLPSDIQANTDILGGNLDGLMLMPGFRFYLSKKGVPRGFFIEPYFKYEKFNFAIDTEVVDDENERFQSTFDGKYSGTGLGFQFGFQFLIARTISVEWAIIGFEGKSAQANFTFTDLTNQVNMNDVYDELKADFSDNLPVIGDNIEYEIGSNFVNGKVKGVFLPGVRSAFSIGIAF